MLDRNVTDPVRNRRAASSRGYPWRFSARIQGSIFVSG